MKSVAGEFALARAGGVLSAVINAFVKSLDAERADEIVEIP
jgi:hypothetical protein